MKVRQDCAQLFMLFTGMRGQLMMPPMTFIEQTRLVDRNLCMVRDLNECCYQRGVSKDLPDIPAFLHWQKVALSAFPHVRDVYCIGSSAGAYAALLVGHFLKVKQVFAFAPPVPVSLGDRITYVDERYANIAGVLAAGNGVTRFEVYYNEATEIDRVAAERLRGLPGVTLHPQQGSGHGVLPYMAKQGLLATLLPPFQRV